MNKLVLVTTLILFAAAPQADEESKAYGACKAEVKSALGAAASVKLRSMRHQLKGSKLKLKVSGTDAGTLSVTCVYKDGQASLGDLPVSESSWDASKSVSRR